MKINFLKFGFYATMFAMSLFVMSCGGGEASTDDVSDDKTEQQEGHDDHEGHDHEDNAETGKEHTAAYVCPMHCEDNGSDTEGKCPVCGMDYVVNDKHTEGKHEH